TCMVSIGSRRKRFAYMESTRTELPITDRDAARLVQSAGLGRPARIERMTGGVWNNVYRVDGRWVVRIGARSDGARFAKAAAFLRAVDGRVKAPRLLQLDCTPSLGPHAVMIYEYLDGTILSELWPSLPNETRRRYVR